MIYSLHRLLLSLCLVGRGALLNECLGKRLMNPRDFNGSCCSNCLSSIALAAGPVGAANAQRPGAIAASFNANAMTTLEQYGDSRLPRAVVRIRNPSSSDEDDTLKPPVVDVPTAI